MKTKETAPVLQNKKLGWIAQTLDEKLDKFWKLDECTSAVRHFTEEETRFQNNFINNVTRNETSRFFVTMLLK